MLFNHYNYLNAYRRVMLRWLFFDVLNSYILKRPTWAKKSVKTQTYCNVIMTLYAIIYYTSDNFAEIIYSVVAQFYLAQF